MRTNALHIWDKCVRCGWTNECESIKSLMESGKPVEESDYSKINYRSFANHHIRPKCKWAFSKKTIRLCTPCHYKIHAKMRKDKYHR